MTLDPGTKAFLEAAAAQEMPKFRDLPAAAGRELAIAMIQALDLPPEDLAHVRDLSFPGPAGDLAARLYAPAPETAGPVVAFFHGGGRVFGDLGTHDSFCRHLSRRLGLRVVAIDYRRAPEHAFPAAYDDCLAAIDWLSASPTTVGAAVAGLALAGDSAGGEV